VNSANINCHHAIEFIKSSKESTFLFLNIFWLLHTGDGTEEEQNPLKLDFCPTIVDIFI